LRGASAARCDQAHAIFHYITPHPWIDDTHFNSAVDPYLTGNQARAIDSAIDMYNDDITEVVSTARQDGRTGCCWTQLAYSTELRPADTSSIRLRGHHGGRLYQLPPQIGSTDPDTRLAVHWPSGLKGTYPGGTFLTGRDPPDHHCVCNIGSGVHKRHAVGRCRVLSPRREWTPRTAPILIDFGWAIQRDTLISDPPKSITYDLASLSWATNCSTWVKSPGP